MFSEFEGDFDFDFDADDCDEAEDEDDLDTRDADDSRDERFVALRTSQIGSSRPLAFAPAVRRAKFPTQFRVAGGKAAAASLTPEEELLKLARSIQADVEAMRAELNELREEVRSAPRRQ